MTREEQEKSFENLKDLCNKVGVDYSETPWSVYKFIEFARKCYQQGRADAIDEIVEKIGNYTCIDTSEDFADGAVEVVLMEDILKNSEQLKGNEE